jgi:hypothetical protein
MGAQRLAIGTFPTALAAAQGHDIVLQQLRSAGPMSVSMLNNMVAPPDAPWEDAGQAGAAGSASPTGQSRKRPAGKCAELPPHQQCCCARA